ncbi:MAG: hypothetical protein ACI9CD_000528 [Candidatus Deianiraeaceae bacterium]|jgi:hypothetical protein
MKRDLDLIRNILLDIEECESFSSDNFDRMQWLKKWQTDVPNEVVEENREEYALYQIKIIQEDGLFSEALFTMKYTTGGVMPIPNMQFSGLSPQGHEFLDSIRHKDIFEKIKETAKENGGSFTLELVKELGMSYLKKKIGL